MSAQATNTTREILISEESVAFCYTDDVKCVCVCVCVRVSDDVGCFISINLWRDTAMISIHFHDLHVFYLLII